MSRPWIYLCFICLFALAFLWGGCGHERSGASKNLLEEVQHRGYLLVGVKYDSPPFGFLDADGQLKGYEIELAHALAERIIGKPDAIRFIPVNSSTRVPALQANQVDFVLATMTITPERKKIVNFTEPYYTAAQAVLVKASSPFQSLKDLKTARIMYIIGSTGEDRLKAMMPQAQLLGFRSTTEAFTSFYAGRADALSTDDSILSGFLHQYCGLRMLPDRISQEPYGIAFRKDAASQPLLDRVQEVMDTLTREDFLEDLSHKWQQSLPPAHC